MPSVGHNHFALAGFIRDSYYLGIQGCRKRFRAGGANRAKEASRAVEANRGNRAKEAFCHIPLFFFVVNISTIKTSKIWCTLASRIKNLAFSF